MVGINFKAIEKKWQKRWEKEKVFEVREDKKKKKFYVLEMYPYPSASGLHMGHAFNYTIGDIYSRYKRMKGFNVLYPMGFDSFGLPAENAAIQAKEKPKKFTEKAIKNYIRQMKELGLSYDWSRSLMSHDPEYYKWNQYFFLKFFEKGLAYRKKAPVNWCAKCDTVLANEQVHNGKCWRHKDCDVEIKLLEQWFVKTTDYADELLRDIDKLEWPERIKIMQRNWIGKSIGTEILFEIKDRKVILVDAVQCLVDVEGNINKEMKDYLDSLDNKKIILTNAPLDRHKKLFGKIKDYEVFTLENKPSKKNPDYYNKFLDKHGLTPEQVIYFEHDEESVRSAESIGITSSHYGGDIEEVRKFIEENVNTGWPIFTTRVDTLFGVTFMVIAAQHPRLMKIVTPEQKKKVEAFLKRIRTTKQEDMDNLDKEGVFTGSYAVNPLTNEKVPIWAGNFVVADYGSGMVMAVPAHDQRDFEFAEKYKIPIKVVVEPEGGKLDLKLKEAFTDYGVLVNSGVFDKLKSKEAIEHIINALEMKKLGKKTIQFKLRDWLISRQRYWGTPIPIIYCEACGIVPVPEKELPVLLPEKVKFGKGNPLEGNKKFVDVKCPKCDGKARRETDTMDTFFDSSWYYLRYCDNKNKKRPFDSGIVNYWMNVDQYIGGAEHAVMHLIYARFFTKVLRDFGLLKTNEPFQKLFNQGMLHGEDGAVMSKSRGNVVLPEKVSERYGIDTARLFMVSVASPDKDMEWSGKGIEGSLRFVKKVIEYFKKVKIGKSSEKVEHKINKAIKEITKNVEFLEYNYAIIKFRALFEGLELEVGKKELESFVKMFSVFCPHVGEEIWEKIGGKGFVSKSDWPKVDEGAIDERFDKVDEAVEKVVSDIQNILRIVNKGEKVYLYVLPSEIGDYDSKEIEMRVGKSVIVFAVNDKDKFDPEGKSKKSRPGKPAIFVE